MASVLSPTGAATTMMITMILRLKSVSFESSFGKIWVSILGFPYGGIKGEIEMRLRHRSKIPMHTGDFNAFGGFYQSHGQKIPRRGRGFRSK
jgi:hypothetical protein